MLHRASSSFLGLQTAQMDYLIVLEADIQTQGVRGTACPPPALGDPSPPPLACPLSAVLGDLGIHIHPSSLRLRYQGHRQSTFPLCVSALGSKVSRPYWIRTHPMTSF